MPKPEWGVKRLCGSCGTRFYDLGQEEPECPNCGAVYVSALAMAERAKASKATAAEDDDEDVVDDEDELETADDVVDGDDDGDDGDDDSDDVVLDDDGDDDDDHHVFRLRPFGRHGQGFAFGPDMRRRVWTEIHPHVERGISGARKHIERVIRKRMHAHDNEEREHEMRGHRRSRGQGRDAGRLRELREEMRELRQEMRELDREIKRLSRRL